MKNAGMVRAIARALGITITEPKIGKPPKTSNGGTRSGAADLKRAAKKRNMAKARASKR